MKYKYVFNSYMYTGADTGFSSGGDKSGAKRPKIFLSPPWAPQGGDRGGRGGTEFCTLLRFCTIYIMSLQENIKKKIFVPPWITQGGDILAVPPPWIAQAGDNSQGGNSPPPEIAQGGTQRTFTPSPCICSCIDTYWEEGMKSKLNSYLLSSS